MCLNSDKKEKARKNVKRELHARRYGKSNQEVEEEPLLLLIRPGMGQSWAENFAISQIRKYFRMLTKKRYEGTVTIPNPASGPYQKFKFRKYAEEMEEWYSTNKVEFKQEYPATFEDPRKLCSNCRGTVPKDVVLLPKLGNCEKCGAWGLNT